MKISASHALMKPTKIAPVPFINGRDGSPTRPRTSGPLVPTNNWPGTLGVWVPGVAGWILHRSRLHGSHDPNGDEPYKKSAKTYFCGFHQVLVLFVWLLSAAHAGAFEARDIRLMIGPGFAVVSEERPLELEQGKQTILLEGIPDEADLSTLVIRTRSGLLKVVEWDRLPADSTASPLPPDADGDGVLWSPDNAGADRASTLSTVRCLIEVQTAGTFPLQLTYVLPGFSWRMEYEITLRGETEGEGEPLSVDMAGFVHITNPSSRDFRGAHIVLTANDPAVTKKDPRNDPGFLLLDEANPLSDFWLEPDQQTPIQLRYMVDAETDVAAGVVTRVPFVDGRRMPAESLYLMTAERFPLASRDRKQPLQKIIVFRNLQALGLGRALPLGDAQVYIRNRRERLLSGAHIPHTAANEEIRIDMGRAEDVTGARIQLSSRNVGRGINLEEFELSIDNQTRESIRVEIDEKPPLTLGWNVTRSSATYYMEEGRLLFRPSVKPQREERIRYSLRVREPAL